MWISQPANQSDIFIIIFVFVNAGQRDEKTKELIFVTVTVSCVCSTSELRIDDEGQCHWIDRRASPSNL